MMQGMENDKHPAALLVTEDDFRNSGWKDALLKAKGKGYPFMSLAFQRAADQAMNEGRQSHGKVLWLFANACSMMLRSNSPNEPFAPFWSMSGKRTAIPDDLSESDIAFYGKVVDAVDDPRLKARLADLVWLKQTGRDRRFALAAIDAYRSINLDKETLAHIEGWECWTRAIQLARVLGKKGSGGRTAKIEAAILECFESTTKQDGRFAFDLSDLLASNGLGRAQCKEVARKLESLAGEFDADGDFIQSRKYRQAAAGWFRIAGNKEKEVAMVVCVAECWVKEAKARSSNMIAATCYEKAIQTYRTIPRTERTAHRVDDRIKELRARMEEAGKKSLDEMVHVSSPGMDVSKFVDVARQAVGGKTPIEALKTFCDFPHRFDAKEARENAIEQIRGHPLPSIIPTVFKSRDGRTVAKRPGLDISGASLESDEVAIRSAMIQNYGIMVGLRVQCEILPALEVLWLEHRLRERDFVDLADQSPIVPKDRVVLFGKGLFSGYDRDFVTALHLLVPQIENLVRYHLKQSGVNTAIMNSNGIETEVGLSNLINMPEAEKIFGADICCEIRMLFCDDFGPNLRNGLAHGLLSDGLCESVESVYAWWFGLRMVFNTFWESECAAEQNNGDERQKNDSVL